MKNVLKVLHEKTYEERPKSTFIQWKPVFCSQLGPQSIEILFKDFYAQKTLPSPTILKQIS